MPVADKTYYNRDTKSYVGNIQQKNGGSQTLLHKGILPKAFSRKYGYIILPK